MAAPLRLLLVEDSERDAALLVRLLQEGGYAVAWERVETAEEMAGALDRGGWDLVVADYTMPSFGGPAALALIRSRDPDLPLIIVSGSIDEEAAVACMRQGAADYLLKDRLGRLAEAVRHALEERRLRAERLRAEEALRAGEASFRLLFAANPLPMWVYDRETQRFLEVNEAAVARYGYSREEFLAMGIADIRPPEDIPRLLENLRQPSPPLRGGDRWRHRLKDGHLIDVEITAHALTFAGHEAVLVVAADITERRRAERAREEAKAAAEELAQVRQEQAAEAEAMAAVSAALAGSLDPGTVYRIILEQAARVLPFDHAEIVLYQDGWAVSAASLGEPSVPPGTRLVPLDTGTSTWLTLQRGEVAHLADTAAVPDWPASPPWPGPRRIRSAIIAPLIIDGALLGSFEVNSFTPRFFAERHPRVAAAFGERATQAVRNARLYAAERAARLQAERAERQIQRQLERLSALRAIDLAITASLDLRLTLGIIIGHVIEQLGIHAVAVLRLNPGTQVLECVAERGFRGTAAAKMRLRLGEGHAGRAALRRTLISVPDLREERVARQPLIGEEAFISYFAVPLIAKGQVKGVLELFHRAPLSPEPDWLEFLEALAGQTAIAMDNASLFEDLQQANTELILAYDSTIEGWSRALDLRDKETEGHSRRVTEMTLLLARQMGLREAELVHARRGALLHDIGKMGIPDAILLKPGKLSEEEWEVMRKHPVYAYELLAPIAYLRPALDIPYCHHEKWDGTGYPRGLAGEQIPLAARIFAVADVYDALRSDRPYREGWPEGRVREHIRAQAGAHFDPRVVQAFDDLPEDVFPHRS